MIFPEVIRVVDLQKEVVQLELYISNKLNYFEGHFPGNPILPGIVQIHWAIYYAQKYFAITRSICKIDKVKFRTLILPDTGVHLKVEYKSRNYLLFYYWLDAKLKSSGRIVLQYDEEDNE